MLKSKATRVVSLAGMSVGIITIALIASSSRAVAPQPPSRSEATGTNADGSQTSSLTSARTSGLHCSTGSDVADPGGVHGLFVAGANQTRSQVAAAEMKYLLKDKTICGADLVIPWSAIDRGPSAKPRYDWSFLEKAAAPWEAAGKVVNLIVWGSDELVYNEVNIYGEKCLAGASGENGGCQPATPRYVLATAKTVNCGPKVGTEFPVYWEPSYEKPWRAFQAALVAHVAHNSNIGYIRFGLGTGGEDFPSIGYKVGTCSERWIADGLTAARWLNWSISQVDYEASLDSHHPLNIAIDAFPGAPMLSGQVAAKAANHGIGFGFQGMTVDQLHLEESSPEKCLAEWCRVFKTWMGRVPLEAQTYSLHGSEWRRIDWHFASALRLGHQGTCPNHRALPPRVARCR